VSEGKHPLLNRDYFWTAHALVQYAAVPPKSSVSVLLQQPAIHPLRQLEKAEARQHAEEKLLKCVHNDEDAFANAHFEAMLVACGWAVVSHRGETMYVPHWRSGLAKQHNYSSFERGVDYFVQGDEALLDHLMVSVQCRADRRSSVGLLITRLLCNALLEVG
jgi:hypothetical protein